MSSLLKRVACAPDAQPSKKAQLSQTLSRVTCAGDTASPEEGFVVTRDDVQTPPSSLLALFNLFILFILFLFLFLFFLLFIPFYWMLKPMANLTEGGRQQQQQQQQQLQQNHR